MPYPELNLARRPFRDYRLFTVFVAILTAAALGVTFISVRGVVRRFSVNESTQERIRALEDGIREAKAGTESLRKSLGAVDFKGVTGAAASINGLVERRSFAWSRILEHLETALPEDVRLVSLGLSGEPGRGGIRVRLACVTTARDGMLRAVTALDEDPAFSDILPGSFADEEFSKALGKKFDLEASFKVDTP